jgi:hypothetical protein
LNYIEDMDKDYNDKFVQLFMKTLAKIALAAASLLPLAACSSTGYRDSAIKTGIELSARYAAPRPEKVPARVRQEASNPTLTSPYTGNSWSGGEIGSYRASQGTAAIDLGVFAEAEPFEDADISPYLKMSLKYSFGPTKGGEWSWYYTHKEDMRDADPSEWILYLRDDSRTVFPLSPEAGARISLSDDFKLKLGAKYERVIWRYYKGYEAFGKPHLSYMGKSELDVISAMIGAKIMEDGDFSMDLDCIIPLTDEKGFGLALSINCPF